MVRTTACALVALGISSCAKPSETQQTDSGPPTTTAAAATRAAVSCPNGKTCTAPTGICCGGEGLGWTCASNLGECPMAANGEFEYATCDGPEDCAAPQGTCCQVPSDRYYGTYCVASCACWQKHPRYDVDEFCTVVDRDHVHAKKRGGPVVAPKEKERTTPQACQRCYKDATKKCINLESDPRPCCEGTLVNMACRGSF